MIGQTISHYRVLEKIGEGGMGEVYLAEDTRLDPKVTLKFLPQYLQQDEVAQKRFVREAKSAAAIDHPYICKIYEPGETEDYSNGTTYFFHADHLGTPRVQTNVNGNVVETWDNYPFGEQWTKTGGAGNEHRFTGHLRDTESGNEYAGARYYSSTRGRWLSVDPMLGRMINPQRLNKYAYVLNNPTRYIDPDGADEVVWNSGGEVTVYGDILDAPSTPKPLSLDGIPINTQYLIQLPMSQSSDQSLVPGGLQQDLEAFANERKCLEACIKAILASKGAPTNFDLFGALPWQGRAGVLVPRSVTRGRIGITVPSPFGSMVYIDRRRFASWFDALTPARFNLMAHEAFHVAEQNAMGEWYLPYYLGFFAWNYLQDFNYDGAYGTIPSEIMATEYAKEFEDWLNGMGLEGVDLCPCED